VVLVKQNMRLLTNTISQGCALSRLRSAPVCAGLGSFAAFS